MRMMLALAEHKSMTTTAKKLHVTQPALTYQLKVIDEELGVKVFDRTRSGTTLTAEGAFLCESIRQIVNDYDEAVRLTRAMAKGSSAGTVRIGISGCSRDIVSFFLNVVSASVPFTLIPCGSSNPIKLLRDGVIDFWSASEAALQESDADMCFLNMTSVGQSVFVSEGHHLSECTSLSVRDLAMETVWTLPGGNSSASANTIRHELAGFDTNVKTLLPGTSGVASALSDNDVVVYDDGYLPLPSAHIRRIPLVGIEPEAVGLIYLKSAQQRLDPTISKLQELVLSNYGREVSSSELDAQRITSAIDEIANTVHNGGMESVVPLVEYGLRLGISAQHLLNRGLLAGMESSETDYREGRINVAQMGDSVATANLAMEALQPSLAEEEARPITGTAVIGTAAGDMHDIGKHLVRIMLESRNINVADLGTQVEAQAFVDHLLAHSDCNLVLISVGNTEALEAVRETVDALRTAGLRDQVFVMVGGNAASPEFADEIGADAYTTNALEAADKASELLRI